MKWVRMRMMCAFHLVTGGGETGTLLSRCVRLTYRMTSQGVKQEEIMPQGTFREQESRGGLSADPPSPFHFLFPTGHSLSHRDGSKGHPVLKAGYPSDGFSGSQTPCCPPRCFLHIWKWQKLWACDWWVCCRSRTRWA